MTIMDISDRTNFVGLINLSRNQFCASNNVYRIICTAAALSLNFKILAVPVWQGKARQGDFICIGHLRQEGKSGCFA